MDRPGLMAPPDLYDHPPRRGLASAGAEGLPFPIGLRATLWSVAAVLGTVELCLASLG